ncbi:class I SAM-dependent methyltransferase [Paenibacillus jiagnxiensis]|uniref:class I SAM-dependent methyltransferase n=1 Tax=Paenibacillus jiagnxiensis TaxID=3228926 RepID=UPI0033B76990
MKGLESEIQHYWNQRGKVETLNEQKRFGGSAGFREHPIWLSLIPVLLNQPAGGRIIRRVADMGSGTGIMAEHLTKLGYEVIAVEYAASRAELAKERLARYPNAEVRLGDAVNPPIEQGEVDAVISRNLIWLLPDPLKAVQCWCSLTGPGGRIAAIDSTRRMDHRNRMSRQQSAVRRFLGIDRRSHQESLPFTSKEATPLSNISHPDQAAEIWRQAGAVDVRIEDLSWVTAAKLQRQSFWSRFWSLSGYYAILGDQKH